MQWPDPTQVQAGVTCLVVAAALGWLSPRLIARLPEPGRPDAGQTEAGATGRGLPAAPPKEPYADIARLPHLAARLAAWSGLIAGAVGLVLGWTGALLFLVPLVPVGAVLALVDWRTTLLPTRLLHPTYGLLAVTIPLAAAVDRDLDALVRAGWGWLVVGGWFWVFWWALHAWGFGDVRLARVLGPALGYLGWAHLASGLALMVAVGGLGGLVLGIAHRSLRRRYPYGPFMLVGALLAVLAGPTMMAGLGY